MATIQAHGVSCALPRGWDGQIYLRAPDGPTIGPPGTPPQGALPVAHLANFALPPERGDYGGGAVNLMRSGGVFIALLEHPAVDAASPLFADKQPPWPLGAASFSASRLHRNIAPHGGCQAFFRVADRPFCLYAVISDTRIGELLAGVVNEALAGLVIS